MLAPDDDGWRVLPAAGDARSDRRRARGVRSQGRRSRLADDTALNELASALVASIQLARRARSRAAHRDRRVHRADDPVPRRSGARAARSARRARPHAATQLEQTVDARAARRQPRRRELRRQRRRALPRQHVEAAARESTRRCTRRSSTPCATTGSRCRRWRASSRSCPPSACSTRGATSRSRRSTRVASRARPATSSSRCATCARSCTRSRSSRRSRRSPAATCRSTSSWAARRTRRERDAAKRIEQFLPHLGSVKALDPPLHRLLAGGPRVGVELRHPAVAGRRVPALDDRRGRDDERRRASAKRWWAGASDASEFLASQPAKPVAAIVARPRQHHGHAARSRCSRSPSALEQRSRPSRLTALGFWSRCSSGDRRRRSGFGGLEQAPCDRRGDRSAGRSRSIPCARGCC